MKYLGKIEDEKDIVNLGKLNEVKDTLLENISDAEEVVISATEPTGENRKEIWVDTSSSSSGSSSIPTKHASTHAAGGTDPVTAESIGAFPASKVMYGTSLPSTVTEGAIFFLITG